MNEKRLLKEILKEPYYNTYYNFMKNKNKKELKQILENTLKQEKHIINILLKTLENNELIKDYDYNNLFNYTNNYAIFILKYLIFYE